MPVWDQTLPPGLRRDAAIHLREPLRTAQKLRKQTIDCIGRCCRWANSKTQHRGTEDTEEYESIFSVNLRGQSDPLCPQRQVLVFNSAVRQFGSAATGRTLCR